MNPSEPSASTLRQWADIYMGVIPFSRMSGMTITAVEAGRTSLMLPARELWSGDVERNRVHTGCLCVLADTACGFAVGTAVGEVGRFATLDLRMDYLRSADAGHDLLCQAHCHRVSRNVAFVTGELRQEGCEDLIALVNATFMRSAPPLHRGALRGEAPRPVSPAPAPPAAMPGARRALPEGRSPYVDFLGVVEYPQVEAGPIFCLPFKEDLIGNPMMPALHGGVLAGFAETVMALHLVATNPPAGKAIPKAVDFAIDYLRPARPMDTYGQGVTIRLGSRVSLVQCNLWQEDPQRPVAATRGHWLMPTPEV